MRSPPSGGCDFAADPSVAATDQPIFWTEVASPTVLRFGASPGAPRGGNALSTGLFNGAEVRTADDGLHAVWKIGGSQLQALLQRSGVAREAVILPLDDTLEHRALTAIRLVRFLSGRPPPPDPAPVSALRRARLVQVLRTLDARADGASLRDVAEGLFGRRLSGRAWQDSDVQARTKRLVRGAKKLMLGGYSELLNPLHRRRAGDETAAP